MGMQFFQLVALPNDAPVVAPAVVQALVGQSAEVHFGGLTDKGYDIVKDPAATFTANLEVSVDGRAWDMLAALATGQGAISAYYNFARINVTHAGDLGTTTAVQVAGKARS